MKLERTTLAHAFALSTALLWVICTLFVALLPEFSLTVSRWWMHGLDISVMGSWSLTIANFVLGGVTLVVSAWVTGWVFGWSWEMVSKPGK